jgi:predicted nucleotidyltransferase
MAKKIHLKKSLINSIHLFLDLVAENGIPVSRAILFGSYAKGKESSDSDVDIAVISSRFGKDNLKEMMFLRKLALKIDSHIEPIPFSPEDLNDPYSTLMGEIRRYGIPLLR